MLILLCLHNVQNILFFDETCLRAHNARTEKKIEKSLLTQGRKHISSRLAKFQRESSKHVKALGFCVNSTFGFAIS